MEMFVHGGETYPIELVIKQIDSFYGITNGERAEIQKIKDKVFSRVEYNFKHIANKYYRNESGVVFNPLHTAQYTMFLYLLANTLYKQMEKDEQVKVVDLCNKIYGLSKVVSSADIYYEVDLPDVFFFDHPQGSVLGRAKYGNYFSVSQGCTVGGNKDHYPEFGENVHMFSGAKVLGNCKIGDRVLISANTYIKDMDIPSNSIVFGSGKGVVVHPISKEKFEQLCEGNFVVET